jgi:phage shock protein PspC (stress-responsive transcriptional regulator)
MTAPLARSRNDRVLAGVMGGIARRFGWNPTLLRVLYVVVSIASAGFPGILVYLILWLLMPEEGA